MEKLLNATENSAGRPYKRKTSTASEDFKKNIQSGKRYVDKTKILVSLLDLDHETSFFLRPRRFGKTLMISMLRYFLEDTLDEAKNRENRALFADMEIMREGAFYTEQMTSYPVISLTFQGIKGGTYETAYNLLVSIISAEYNRHRYLLDSDRISPEHKVYYQKILESITREEGVPLPVSELVVSLQRLSGYLTAAHGKKAVILIDEYDVPLEKAWQDGYYEQMAAVVSALLQNVLKTNSENLQFAVITGCLRIAKESIYTGLNNPRIDTVLSRQFAGSFGFTEEEVRKLLSDSGLQDQYGLVKEWYDGYTFGNTTVYNPWSVINFIEDFEKEQNTVPGTPRAGTSSNLIIRELAARGSTAVKEKAEMLMRGEAIQFRERDNIVYSELTYHDDNVFNVMLHSGYLTAVSFDGENITAVIPNREVMKIYRDQISDWFSGSLGTFDVKNLYQSLLRGGSTGAAEVQRILTEKFLSSMSYFDTQEAYYHGVLLALLQLNETYLVTSSREAGKGRFDLQSRERGFRRYAIIVEVKVTKTSRSLYADAKRAASQIRTKRYAIEALREGYETVFTYGISFFQKDCAVSAGEKYTQRDLERLTESSKNRKKKTGA